MAFPTGWGRKCALVVQASKVDANQSNFPVLLMEDTLPSEMFDADGSYPALNGGGDIRFSSDSVGNTQLSCEVVTFTIDNDPANGVAEIWVKVPSISSSSNTTIYVWYHKSGESQPAIDAAYGAESVWDSSFKMVQHMEDVTTSTITDSTSNDNDGTKKAANEPIEASGQIGKGQNFDGINDYITVPHNVSIDFADEDFTVSVWFKTNSTKDLNYIFTKNYGGVGVKWYGADIYVPGPCIDYYIDDGTNLSYSETTDDYNDNAWHQIFFVRNTTTNKVIIYIDGAWNVEVNDISGSITNTGDLIIGGRADFNVDRFYENFLDEFHISEGLRSADWIKTEYNNQNDPATFVVEGTPEAGGGETFYKTITGNQPASTGSIVSVSAYKQIVIGDVPNPVASITKKTNTLIVGNVPNPVASIIKKTIKELIGVQPNPTGNVVPVSIYKQIVSGNTPNSTATITRGVKKDVVGNVPSPAAAITKKISIQVVGNVPTSTAVIIKKTEKELAGEQIAPAGSVTYKSVYKQSAAGDIPNPEGNLSSTIKTALALIGNMPASFGNAIKRIGKMLIGSQPAAVGNITKQTEKNVAGEQPAPIGNISHTTKIFLSGVMGNITGIVSKILNPLVPTTTKLCKLIGSCFKKFLG